MAGMAQFSPFLDMFVNTSSDFVHRWNAQLTELTAHRTWLDLHKLSKLTVLQLSGSQAKMYESISEIIRSAAPMVKFT